MFKQFTHDHRWAIPTKGSLRDEVGPPTLGIDSIAPGRKYQSEMQLHDTDFNTRLFKY